MTGRKHVKKKIKLVPDCQDEIVSSEFENAGKRKKNQKESEKKKIKLEPNCQDETSQSDSENVGQRKKNQKRIQKKKIQIEPDCEDESSHSDSEKVGQRKKNQKRIQKKKIKIDPDCEDESSHSDSENAGQRKSNQVQPDHGRVNYEAEYDDADEIIEILEKKKAQEQLASSEAQKLRDLVIKLRHQVPPQHEIERACGSHVPTTEEKKAFEELIHPDHIKKGVFSPSEDDIIASNWKAFCKLHNWSKKNPQPFIFMRHNVGFYMSKWNERKKFVQFLADGLPHRTLYSVYHRFRNLYDNPKVRTNYTEQEDQYIIKYIEQSKNINETRKFADLAKVLDRTRASVWRRYRLLRKKREQREMDS